MKTFLLLLLASPTWCIPMHQPTRYHQTKPPMNAQINWSSDLAQGLIAAYIFNEGSGGTVHNLVNPVDIGTFTATTIGWAPTADGPGLQFLASQVGAGSGTGPGVIVSAADPSLKNVKAMAFKFFTSVATTNNQRIFGYGGTVATAWEFITYSSRINFSFDGGALGSQAATTNLANNVAASVVFNWGGQTSAHAYNWFVNGSSQTISVQAGEGTSADVPTLTFGNRGDLARVFNGVIYYVYLYNRPLSQQEAYDLYIEPYSMLESPSPMLWWMEQKPASTTHPPQWWEMFY
jgi:hypothetical protein